MGQPKLYEDYLLQIEYCIVTINRDTQLIICPCQTHPLQLKDIRFDKLPSLEEIATPDQLGELRAV